MRSLNQRRETVWTAGSSPAVTSVGPCVIARIVWKAAGAPLVFRLPPHLRITRGRAGRRGPGNRPGLATPACRTRRPQCLAAPGLWRRCCKLNAAQTLRSPPVARRPARGVFWLAPCGPRWTYLSDAVPFGEGAYPPLVGQILVPRHGPAGVIAPDAQGSPLIPSGARNGAPGPHGLGRRIGCRVAPDPATASAPAGVDPARTPKAKRLISGAAFDCPAH
jgi:hypothetical protein